MRKATLFSLVLVIASLSTFTSSAAGADAAAADAVAASAAAADAAAADAAAADAGVRCPEHFYKGDAPDFRNAKLASKARPLCYSAFAVMHSGVARTPLWSAEFLTTSRLADSRAMKRQNQFHAEDNLPADERAELNDYARSGFDRGHMSPSADMPNTQAQAESFSLANIVPQNRRNNQQLWAAIEEGVRKLANSRGELYVITGPLFEGNSVKRLKGRVLIPTSLFKAILDPRSGEAGAYLVVNQADAEARTVSIAEIEQIAGINLFPALDEAARQSRMSLPEPSIRARRKPREAPAPTN